MLVNVACATFVIDEVVFHQIISPPPAKTFEKKITFYIHSPVKKFALPFQTK
jgi:hypothetical protein